jgi:hypothetical protein
MGTVLGSQGLAQWGEKAPLVNLLRYQTRAEPSLQLFSRQSLEGEFSEVHVQHPA